MKNFRKLGRTGWIVLALVWVVMIGLGIARSKPKTQRIKDLLISNLTQYLKVSSIDRVGADSVELTLLNESDKDVLSFAYSLHPSSGWNADTNAIPPRMKLRERVSLRPALARGESRPIVTVMAVLFDDGTVDGDPAAGMGLQQSQRGRSEAAVAIGDLIRQQRFSSNPGLDVMSSADMKVRIRDLRDSIRLLPEPSLEDESGNLFRASYLEAFRSTVAGSLFQLDQMLKDRADEYSEEAQASVCRQLMSRFTALNDRMVSAGKVFLDGMARTQR